MGSEERLAELERHAALLEQRVRAVEARLLADRAAGGGVTASREPAAGRPSGWTRDVSPWRRTSAQRRRDVAAASSPVASSPVGSLSPLSPRNAGAPPPSTAARWPSGRRAARAELDFEQLLGGRVLAWVGGVSVLAGMALLIELVVLNVWIVDT